MRFFQVVGAMADTPAELTVKTARILDLMKKRPSVFPRAHSGNKIRISKTKKTSPNSMGERVRGGSLVSSGEPPTGEVLVSLVLEGEAALTRVEAQAQDHPKPASRVFPANEARVEPSMSLHLAEVPVHFAPLRPAPVIMALSLSRGEDTLPLHAPVGRTTSTGVAFMDAFGTPLGEFQARLATAYLELEAKVDRLAACESNRHLSMLEGPGYSGGPRVNTQMGIVLNRLCRDPGLRGLAELQYSRKEPWRASIRDLGRLLAYCAIKGKNLPMVSNRITHTLTICSRPAGGESLGMLSYVASTKGYSLFGLGHSSLWLYLVLPAWPRWIHPQ
ncbi:hypothetical protein KSP40_PGU015850 [Platanthera guangdongensis]|uniref:Uncharacterized protein n=1 Tax=Platanthera guangdongensis TaxID=2320717 RepID=A0ABR2LEM0_9ASPA